MDPLELSEAFTVIEPGPVALVTTHDRKRDNIMTISWTMVLDFPPVFAITTGEWNYSYAALRKNRECVLQFLPSTCSTRWLASGRAPGKTQTS